MLRSRLSWLLIVVVLSLVTLSGVTAQGMTYDESPMLKERVAAGELPPVEERLPVEPLVVEPIEEIGQYGGTLRFAEANASLWSASTLRQSGLFQYDMANVNISVDMAKSYAFNEDLSEFSFNLR